MENKSHALAAGLFVALVAALLLGLASWLTRDTAQYEVYEISTRESVTGLQPQAPVRYRGVEVGKVEDIRFDPANPGNVLLRLAVQPRAPVTRETFATLGFQGVTGLAYVQLDDQGRAAPPLEPADGAPPRIPLRPGLVSRLGDRGEDILQQVNQTAERLNQLLSDQNQQRVTSALQSIEQAAQSLTQLSQQTSTVLNAQLGPDRVSIPQAVNSLGAAAEALRGLAVEARATLQPVGQLARRLGEEGGTVDQLNQGAAALSQAAGTFGTSTLPRINLMAEEATRAARRLQGAASSLQENPQSLIFGPGRAAPGPGEPGFGGAGGRR
ncbi:MlaD family protein [Ramlibacter rhizophilus]|uniref:MCE family protein n=1 Tax=Ramlibacter rhizophilus TaxID=1781167 RepID=A0A4Z0BHA7_9BURK|nr:MlaD family protein [Ramlibacter rhizophilus]TFY97779.1 MCE family protein [Ramlibacter rhizophilus]